MPPALKKKVGGLPVWAWAALVAGAIGAGLYLRSKHSEDEPTEAAGSPEGNAEELPEYSEPITDTPANGTEFGGGGVGGPGGFQVTPPEEYQPYYPVVTPSEEESAAQGGIIIEPPNVTFEPEINVFTGSKDAGSNKNKAKGKQEKEHCKGKRPAALKGHHVECNGNHWKQVPNAKNNGKQNPTKHMTGGGPPSKKKAKHHKAKKPHAHA